MASKVTVISLVVIGLSAVTAGAIYASRRKPAPRRRRRQLGSAGSQALVPLINDAYAAARADIDGAAQDVKNVVRAGVKRMAKAQRALEKLQDRVADLLPENDDDDRDLMAVYDDLENEGTGLWSDPKEEESYQSLMFGATELLKLGRRLEKRRRRLEALASR